MMGNKLVIVPFDLELSKEITNGEVEGRIITRVGNSVRILCYDVIGNKYKICGLVHNGKSEEPEAFTEKGLLYEGQTDDLDLMLEIPEYMTFKDGDVLTYRPNGDRWCIFIYKGNDVGLMHNYVTYDCDSRENNILTFGKSSYISTLCEPSTESEKQSLIDALKESKEPKAKECLKMLGVEVKTECEFKPFDKVLVRQSETCKWEASFFSNITDEVHKYRCCGMNYMFCIPYNEQTAHLLGTKDNWEE